MGSRPWTRGIFCKSYRSVSDSAWMQLIKSKTRLTNRGISDSLFVSLMINFSLCLIYTWIWATGSVFMLLSAYLIQIFFSMFLKAIVNQARLLLLLSSCSSLRVLNFYRIYLLVNCGVPHFTVQVCSSSLFFFWSV
uniref:Uncharacterized protein n=1 Tax=Oryza brachyantha TaxID=4533 RepID=J3NB27_ORYBR